ncbi:hypothetical protein ACFX13_037885 [Malus domestica]
MEEVDASNGPNSLSLNTLISSNKCISKAIRRTRSMQSFLYMLVTPPPNLLAPTTSLSNCSNFDVRSMPPTIAQAIRFFCFPFVYGILCGKTKESSGRGS